jgi:aryl-alcohol dehydrogenase-like predicted oxidoreductase
MNFRPLGRTGVQVTPLCLGCMMFGGKTNAGESSAIIDRALNAGINFVDTANVYSRGLSEEIVGKTLKTNKMRDKIVLATKVHARMADSDPNALGNTRRHIITECEASLRRLQTDYIDLYQIHRPQSSVPIDEALRALDDLIRSGKVRYIGTSTFAAWQVVESLWVSKELGLNRFVSEQPPYNLLDRRIERELLPMAQTFGLAVIPWSPLAGGLLTGKYKRDGQAPAGSRFTEPTAWDKPRYNERMFDVVEKLRPLAEAKGCTLSQFSLAWVMHQAGVTSPILGPRTMDQLDDNLGALNVTFTEAELKAIDELVARGRMVSPFYRADFGPHPYRI